MKGVTLSCRKQNHSAQLWGRKDTEGGLWRKTSSVMPWGKPVQSERSAGGGVPITMAAQAKATTLDDMLIK
jgi:hypothetical protein